MKKKILIYLQIIVLVLLIILSIIFIPEADMTNFQTLSDCSSYLEDWTASTVSSSTYYDVLPDFIHTQNRNPCRNTGCYLCSLQRCYTVICKQLRQYSHGRQCRSFKYRGLCMGVDECIFPGCSDIYESEYRCRKIFKAQPYSIYFMHVCCCNRTDSWKCSVFIRRTSALHL